LRLQFPDIKHHCFLKLKIKTSRYRMSLPTHHHHDHTHDHADTHAHVQSGHDYAASNKEHFDKEAQNLARNPPAAMVEMTSQMSAAILAEYPFDEDSTAVLDYACGVGM
jgi:hypothetical protein